jgi:hypothetical protein
MVESIFSEPIFLEYILPFLLVFTLVFAVLDKSKLLGEGKRQINAILSLVIGLILIGFPFARDIIVRLIPFLVVSLVILFVFMLLYGFVSGKKEGDVLSKGLKIALGIIFGLAVIVAVLWITGAWDKIVDFTVGGDHAGTIWINALMILVIGGAMAVVLSTGGKEKSSAST